MSAKIYAPRQWRCECRRSSRCSGAVTVFPLDDARADRDFLAIACAECAKDLCAEDIRIARERYVLWLSR